jgi:hypothetical protein
MRPSLNPSSQANLIRNSSCAYGQSDAIASGSSPAARPNSAACSVLEWISSRRETIGAPPGCSPLRSLTTFGASVSCRYPVHVIPTLIDHPGSSARFARPNPKCSCLAPLSPDDDSFGHPRRKLSAGDKLPWPCRAEERPQGDMLAGPTSRPTTGNLQRAYDKGSVRKGHDQVSPGAMTLPSVLALNSAPPTASTALRQCLAHRSECGFPGLLVLSQRLCARP